LLKENGRERDREERRERRYEIKPTNLDVKTLSCHG